MLTDCLESPPFQTRFFYPPRTRNGEVRPHSLSCRIIKRKELGLAPEVQATWPEATFNHTPVLVEDGMSRFKTCSLLPVRGFLTLQANLFLIRESRVNSSGKLILGLADLGASGKNRHISFPLEGKHVVYDYLID